MTAELSDGVDTVLREVLEPGQDIVIGQGAGAPRTLIRALARHKDLLRGSRILLGMLTEDFPDLPGADIRTFFPAGVLGNETELARRKIRYERMSLFELAHGLDTGEIPVDVVLAQGTPPKDGRHSCGVSVDYVVAGASRADAVILETDPQVPCTGVRSMISSERVHTVVGTIGSPYEMRRPSARDRVLAENLQRWIPDGATIQLGMGPWTMAVGERLSTRRNLRVHTGLLGEWIQILDEAGALNRSVDVVATGAAGSADFYRYLDSGSHIALAGAHETHHPKELSELPRLHAVNSVLEIDLLGQANTEIGYDGRRGGIGGLPDFAGAASNASDGLSIIVMSATARDNSRIVPRLRPPAVSLGIGAVDVLVTEYGSADLRDVPDDVRAERIIAVAAPEHRTSLHNSLWRSAN